MQSYQLAPAYVATPRMDLLVWNDFVSDAFDYEFTADALSRNVLWRMFFDPTRRAVRVNWPPGLRSAARQWTAASGRLCNCPARS